MHEQMTQPTTSDYLCRQYGIGASGGPMRQVARGSVGRIWRVDAAGGAFAVKELFWGAEEQAVAHEVAFRDAVVSAGICAPASLLSREGTYLCRLPSTMGGALVRLYTWVDGVPVAAEHGAHARWLGQVLALMHSLRYPTQAPPEQWYEVCPSMEDWRDLARTASDQRTHWAADLKQVLPAVEYLSTLIVPSPAGELITCHLDLAPSNVLSRTSADLAIVDWDNAAAGTAERELGSALLQWHVYAGRIDATAIRNTMDSYAAAQGPGSIRSLSSFAMYITTFLNYLYVQAKAAISADTTSEHRIYAIQQVERSIRGLPSRALLEAVGEQAQK